MKRMTFMIPVFLCCLTAAAQQHRAIAFNSYTAAGFVTGKLPPGFIAQTENGIKFNNWFIGAGFGIDNYYRQTLPLFAAIKKEFPFKKANSLFLYANAGKNLVTKDKSLNNSFFHSTTKGGFYGDAGVGYKIRACKKVAAFFCIGNTIKNIREIGEAQDAYGTPGIYDAYRKFARVSFKLGFQF
jgi:hypothetical protein